MRCDDWIFLFVVNRSSGLVVTISVQWTMAEKSPSVVHSGATVDNALSFLAKTVHNTKIIQNEFENNLIFPISMSKFWLEGCSSIFSTTISTIQKLTALMKIWGKIFRKSSKKKWGRRYSERIRGWRIFPWSLTAGRLQRNSGQGYAQTFRIWIDPKYFYFRSNFFCIILLWA